MPYTVRKQDCKRSDGKSGKYVLKYKPKKPTKKKKDSEGFVKAGCHPSKKSANAQRAAIEGGPRESNDLSVSLESGQVISELELRRLIQAQLSESFRSIQKKKLNEKKEDVDIDLDLEQLDLPSIPPVLRKLLDPNITPAKYADIDQIVDQSGNKDHQAFAIAAFILSYADMDGAVADAILTKTRGLIPKILKARESAKSKPEVNSDQQGAE